MSEVNIQDTVDFLEKRRDSLFEETSKLNVQSENSPPSVLEQAEVTDIKDKILSQISNSPLAQLGEDFIAEQVSKIGTQLLRNAQNLFAEEINNVRTEAESVISTAFSVVTAAITAQNNLTLFFIQQLGQQIIRALDEKEVIRTDLLKSLRELYNATAQLVAGDPFFSKYLAQLRQALRLMFSAQTDLVRLRNNYFVTDIFQVTRYENILKMLEEAEKLMEPEGTQTDTPFTTEGLFANIGIPTESQQLSIVLAIPKLVKEVILNLKGYLVVTARINGLLVAFLGANSFLTAVKGTALRNYTVSILDSAYGRLDNLTQKMAIELNGSPQAYLQPNRGFTPRPVTTSQNALGWLIDLKTIIEQLRLLPKGSLQDLNLNQQVNNAYENAVIAIRALGDRNRGDALLRVTQGQEQLGLIEQQVSRFCLGCLASITSGSVASGILPLGRTTISYLELSRENDLEIRRALNGFVNQQLPFFNAIERLGNSVYSTLEGLGLDRAVDLLRSGRFQEFFDLNSRNATYAAAALGVLAQLRECVGTTEQSEVIAKAEREIRREARKKNLLVQRTAESGIQQQINENSTRINQLDQFREEVVTASEECIVDPSGRLNGDELVRRFSSVLGVNLLADSFGSDKLSKVARGSFDTLQKEVEGVAAKRNLV
jgi:hypothetical protein